MKKILLFASALAGLFLAGSCQRENLEPVEKANTMTYTVQVADVVATKAKALGDDITAVNELVYEVYRTKNEDVETFTADDNLLYHRTAEVSNGVATIELELVNNQNYTVLFWAHVAGNGVYDVDDLTAVTIESPDVANNVNAQAFVGRDFVRNCVSAADGKVTLTRPVSQLNIATTPESLVKFDDAITLQGSSVKVTGLATSYNIGTLSAFGETATDYEYTETAVPTDVLTVNDVDYTYVAMNYIGFAANEGSIVTVKYDINTTEGHINNEILQVPVKANYRTNIIGNLITSKTDYIITLNDEWAGVRETIEIWNGSTITEPKKNEADENIYEIEFASELAWLAAAVNGTLPETKAAPAPQDFAGKTFKLMNDIDLCGYEWTPIGNGSGKHFTGTFDGQGHTIKGMTITKHAGKNPKALFGIVSGTPTIKNLVIEGANVVMPEGFEGDFYAAGLVGSYYGTLTVENVTVKNSTFAGNNKVAGLLAHDGVCSNLKIHNCHVLNCNISSTNLVDGGNVGGLLGLFQGGKDGQYKISNSSVKNSTIVGINSSNTGKRSNGEFVACISSKAGQTLEIENCVVENNTFSQTINGTEPVTYVGPYDNKFVGGERNGYEVLPGVVIIDGAIYVTTAANLQAVLDAATSDVTVKFGADIVGNVTVNQKSGVNVTIDGLEKKYDGVIYIDGKNNYPSNETVKLTNINFETTHAESTEWTFVVGLTAGNSYPHNITIDGCTFKNTVANNFTVGSISFQQFYNLTVKNCTATNMHSLLQTQSCDNTVTVQNVTVIDGKNGISFGNTKTATISGSTIDAIGYGVRAEGTDAREVSLTVTDCEIEAYIPVVVRKLNADNVKKFTINVDDSNKLTRGGDYDVAIGSNEYEEGVAPIKPVSKYELNVADEFSAFPAPFSVASWDEFTAALAAGETEIKLTADITYNKIYNINRGVNINLNGYTLTMSAPALYYQVSSAVSIKNGTIAGKLYAEKGSLTLSNVTFAGTVEGYSITGSLYIKAGNVLATDCVFNSQPSGKEEIRPLMIQTGANGSFKFVNCNFKSNGIQKQVYVNPVTANSTIDFERCTFNKTVNIDLPTGYSLMNLKLAGNKGSFTLGIYDRTKDSLITDYKDILDSYKNNNTGTLRIFYNGGSFYY